MTESEVKDTRTVTCYNSKCKDYRRERPINEKCSCTRKKPVQGAGH